MELTKEEEKAIKSLKRLAKSWPDSLWLYSCNGTLIIMRKNEQGGVAIDAQGSPDQEYIIDTIRGIYNDGGDF